MKALSTSHNETQQPIISLSTWTYRLPKDSRSLIRPSLAKLNFDNVSVSPRLTAHKSYRTYHHSIFGYPGMEGRVWTFIFAKTIALRQFFKFKVLSRISDDSECGLSNTTHPPRSNDRSQCYPSYSKSGSTLGDWGGEDTHSTNSPSNVPFKQDVNQEVNQQPQYSEGPARFVTAGDGSNDCVALLVTDTLISRLRDLYEDDHHLSGKQGPLIYVRREVRSLEAAIDQIKDSIEMAANHQETGVLQEMVQQRLAKLLKVRQRKDKLEADARQLESNVASYRAHIQWVLENAMKEANLLEPHRPLTPFTMNNVESESGTLEVGHHDTNNGKNNTVENVSDEADCPAEHSVISARANDAPEEPQMDVWESYNEALVTMQKVQALFDNRQESYETDLADYLEGFANGIYKISRSDFDRSKLRFGQKVTRALINAEAAFEAAKAEAQAIGAFGSDYHDATDCYGCYEESCLEGEMASYLATKDWTRVHEWLAQMPALVEQGEQEVGRSRVNDWSLDEEVDPADSLSQIDFDDYRGDIDRWEDVRFDRWEGMRALVGGPEVQVGFLVRNVESLERRHSVPLCHRLE